MDYVTDAEFAAAYNNLGNTCLNEVGEALGLAKKTVKNRAGILRRRLSEGLDVPVLISRAVLSEQYTEQYEMKMGLPEKEDAPFEFSDIPMPPPVVHPTPKRGTKRYILTSAQEGSKVHESFWGNLLAYSDYLGADLLVAGYTYNKRMFESADKAAPEQSYHPLLVNYLVSDQLFLGDNVAFCAELNILPTATTPLSGLETYSQKRWGIFPHAKVQLQSVATQNHVLSKQIMTTGTVTRPNYVLKKAGLKANFHHVFGAVLVEVCADGAFFCRHLLGDNIDGSFYDLDKFVHDEEVTTGHRVEALNYGDIHWEKGDQTVAASTWGIDIKTNRVIDEKNSLLDRLKPHHQFFHDLSDFSARNHHNINNPHFLFSTFQKGTDNVEAAMAGSAGFLEATKRDFCKSVVVDSNHHTALTTWLASSVYDYRKDPENAIFYLDTQLRYYRMLSEGISDPPIFEKVLKARADIDEVVFLDDDDSYIIAGDIECAIHGHRGANGSIGSPRQFTKCGSKTNTGHVHACFIIDGSYGAGVSGKLQMGYNKGLSSWNQSHITTYLSGKRAILSMSKGRWHA